MFTLILLLLILNICLTSFIIFLNIKSQLNISAPIKKNPEAEAIQKSSPAEYQAKQKEELLFPLKVQAAERLIVLIERIKPAMLVHRHLANAASAAQLATLMLQNIRDEFEYNISQQLYVSERSWQLIAAAREEIVQLLHLSLASVDSAAPPETLAREMFAANLRFADEALSSLRNELAL